MGLQKFRADEAGEKRKNGSVPWYTRWMGGPTLALIRDCPVVRGVGSAGKLGVRTVYVSGEPLTFFSIPGACRIGGKDVRGWIGSDDEGYVFHIHREG